MLTDNEVSFETAKLASYKGFNLTTRKAYNLKGGFGNYYDIVGESPFDDSEDDFNFDHLRYPAPTRTELQTWLRETRNLHVNPVPYIESFGLKEITGYYIGPIYHTNGVIQYEGDDNYPTYGKALEAGLQKALNL